MCHKLTADDWDLLMAYPGLVDYLIEVRSESCPRLIHYRKIAKTMSDLHGRIDGLSKPQSSPSSHFTKNEELLVADTATWIERTESGLGGRIMALKPPMSGWSENNKKRVCELYARLVVGHQDDLSYETILGDLKRNVELKSVKTKVEIRIPGTCP